MEENEFEELGLTKNESKAYSTLLRHGKLGAAEISKFSSVPYSRIYDILASLEQKGMIKIIPEKSKKFVPSSPEELISIVNKKEESLKGIKVKIEEMKKLYEIREKNPVVLGYGKNAFYKILKEMPRSKKYSYSIKYTSEYRPEWEQKYCDHLKKKVDDRSLLRYDSETQANIQKWIKIGRKNIKKLENSGVAFSIQEGEVLISLIKSNMTLLIRDNAFSEMMKRLFLETYKNAEEIK